MKLRLLSDRAGICFYQEAGSIIDLPAGEALMMIHAGQAEALNSPREVEIETAVLDGPPENAAITFTHKQKRRL